MRENPKDLKHQLNLDGASFKQEAEKAVNPVETGIQVNINDKALKEAFMQANNELRRFISKK